MEIAFGKVEDLAEQLDKALNHYGKRVRVEDKIGPQNVDWEVYKRFEREGAITLFTAFDDDKRLVGFAMYIVYTHPNHPAARIGHCQFLIVIPEFRGHGLGKMLVEIAMMKLKEQGCTHIIHGRRMVYDTVPLFTKMGFDKFEESYIKEL
jgi:GNAT superfamily N-acetyltransferase